MKHEVFISYSTRDKEVANAVCKALEAEGTPCWIAPRDILPGEEYADAIIEALNTCQLFLVILSEESNSSPQVRREVERAVSKNLSILTFRIDNTILSKAMEYYLSNRHWLDASEAAFSRQLQNLNEAVRKLLEQVPAPSEEADAPGVIEKNGPEKPVLRAAEKPPASLPVSKPARVQKKAAWIWLLAPVLVIILAVVGYIQLAGKAALPFPGRTTNPAQPTSTRNFAQPTQTSYPTIPLDTSRAWITGFAQPILSQIAGRSPDFQDDFSSPSWSYSHWNFFDGVKFENGQLVIVATDQWQGTGLTAQASDFVAKYTFSLAKNITKTLSFGFSFRGDTAGKASNHFTFGSDGWCGFGVVGTATSNRILSECPTLIPSLDQPTNVTVIVQGNQAAAYVNDQPIINLEGIVQTGNEISLGGSISEGTVTILIDNVDFWYLK